MDFKSSNIVLMSLSRFDVDNIIRKFKHLPSEDSFNSVRTWNNENTADAEYSICVYLFLLGANIKHRYIPFTYDQHRDYIIEIRDLIERADPMLGGTRKVYLDLGLKSGM